MKRMRYMQASPYKQGRERGEFPRSLRQNYCAVTLDDCADEELLPELEEVGIGTEDCEDGVPDGALDGSLEDGSDTSLSIGTDALTSGIDALTSGTDALTSGIEALSSDAGASGVSPHADSMRQSMTTDNNKAICFIGAPFVI